MSLCGAWCKRESGKPSIKPATMSEDSYVTGALRPSADATNSSQLSTA